MNQYILKNSADAGGGEFYWFSNNKDSYIQIQNGIDSMEKKTISTHEFSEYEDRYQVFGLISLIFITISYVYPTINRKKR